MQQKPRTTEKIETRCNIILSRRRKLLEWYCATKSELRKHRCNELIKTIDEEHKNLETEYRKAKHYQHKLTQFLITIESNRVN